MIRLPAPLISFFLFFFSSLIFLVFFIFFFRHSPEDKAQTSASSPAFFIFFLQLPSPLLAPSQPGVQSGKPDSSFPPLP